MTKLNCLVRGSLFAVGLMSAVAMDAGVKAYAQGDNASSIIISTYRQVAHLDRSQIGGSEILVNGLMDPLIRLDAKGEIYPGLVDSWDQVDENKTRLTLRQDVTFSDGEKFNAEALKINLDRRLEVTTSSNLKSVTGAEVVDEYTLDLLHKPQPQLGLLSELGIFIFPYSPRQIMEDPQSLETAPISTGPYKVVSYESGRELLLEARDDYWGANVEGWGVPSIKNVTVRFGVDPGVGLAALQAGEVDMFHELTPENAALVGDDMRVIRPSPEVFFMRFGLKDEFTSDLRVREAINLAIDRVALNGPFLGMGEPATQLWHSQIAGWADRGPLPEADLERARELIKEAGADGTEMQMVFSTSYKAGIGLMSQAVAAMIEDIGIKVKMTDLDGVRFREYIRETDNPAPLTTLAFGFDGPEVTGFVTSRISCGAKLSTYCNAEVDRHLDLARKAVSAAERKTILQSMMDEIDRDKGVIPLISPPLIWGKSADLQVTPSFGGLMEWKYWTLDR
jgi:peptide/nickel transport system substrate-binding protein